MATDLHREELLMALLANAGIALDAESIAATYDLSVVVWRRSFRRLEEKGLVKAVGDGLYVLTAEGENEVAPRGPDAEPRVVGGVGME